MLYHRDYSHGGHSLYYFTTSIRKTCLFNCDHRHLLELWFYMVCHLLNHVTCKLTFTFCIEGKHFKLCDTSRHNTEF